LSILLCIWTTVWIVGRLHPEMLQESHQEELARRRADEAYQAQRAAAEERTKQLCELRSRCVRYGDARQECAIAADFNRCVSVKMNGEDATGCTISGEILNPPPDLPYALVCALWGYRVTSTR